MNDARTYVLYHKFCGCLWYETFNAFLPSTVKCPRCLMPLTVSVYRRRKWNGKVKSLGMLTVANLRSVLAGQLIERFSQSEIENVVEVKI